MASEYLKWKYRDVKPDAPIEYTKQQKRRNWWHYYRWYVIIGIVLLFVAIDLGKSALHIGEVKPDYQFAYVGSSVLPDKTVEAFETEVAKLGEDLNGDGQVVVTLHQYADADTNGDSSASATVNASGDNAYYAYASEITLTADLETCESYFFLLEDVEQFQKDYEILAYSDGSLPSEWASDYENMGIAWNDCPTLTNLDLGTYTEGIADTQVTGNSQSLLSGLSIARRGFWTDKTCENLEGCEKLWDVLIKQ